MTRSTLAALMLAALPFSVPEALAGLETACPMELLGDPGGRVCTGSDVAVAAAVVGPDNIGNYCFPGQQFTVDIEADVILRGAARWDLGVWIAQDGKVLTESVADGGAEFCEVVPMPDTNFYSVDAGPGDPPSVGSFDNQPDATPASQDACGDVAGIQNNDNVLGIPLTYGDDPTVYNGPVTLTCKAGPGGGVELHSLVSWNQNDPGVCDPLDTSSYDLESSKCSSNVTEIAVDIIGRVTVTKSAPGGVGQNFDFGWSNDSPPTDPGLNPALNPFTLQDGESEEIYAVIGDGTATVTINEESLPANWILGSIQCTGDDVTPVEINGNEVTITLTYDEATPLNSQDDVFCTFNNMEVLPELTLDKTTTTVGFANPGDPIDYAYLVTNSGNVPLAFPVTVADNKTTVSCPADDGGAPNNGDAILDPGESISCSAQYLVTQPDIDAGSVTNLATATADGILSNDDSVTVIGTQTPLLSVVKASVTTSLSNPQTVIYSYEVTNDGNVTLTGIALTDDNDEDDLVCPFTTLAPTASMTCLASHDFTQAELDANGSPVADSGLLSNTVSASSDQGASAQDSLDIPIVQSPGLEILKSGSWNDDGEIDGVAEIGETVSYTITVNNTGNVALAPVAVTDPLITDAPNNGTIVCPGGNPIASMAPDEQVVCTATYVLIDADITAGQVDNTATATSGDVSGSDDETVLLPTAPGLALVKTGVFNDESGDGFAQEGETITYTFDVTNEGSTVTLTNVSVTDPLVSPIDCSPEANPIVDLAPGEAVQCSGTYQVTQDDVDLGRVDNTAMADSDQTDMVSDDETVPLEQNIAWDIAKSGTFEDESDDGLAQPGETISYILTVSNTGLVTITDVLVSDVKIDPVTCPGGNPIQSIAPGASVDCTGSYEVTQPDIDAGQVVNLAIGDPAETPPDNAESITPLPQQAGMTIEKSSATTEVTAPGTVVYGYQVINTGNMTLTGISLSDDNDNDDLSCPAATLAPQDDMSCVATHTVTQAEIDNNGSPVADSGVVFNTVTGSAAELSEPVTDDLSIPINVVGSLTVQKNSPVEEITEEGPVGYVYLVTNMGDVTLTGIALADDNIDGSVDCGGVDTLAPGDDVLCNATHTVTTEELEANGSPVAESGVLHNVVTASSEQTEDVTDELSIPINYARDLIVRVSKQFSDGNPGEVTVQLTCNAGIPLQQKFILSDGEHVSFSVRQFQQGEMNCHVEEILGLQGYTPEYLALDPDGIAEEVRSESDGCYYEGISGGILVCDITNGPSGFTYEVTKAWVDAEGILTEPVPADVLVECRNVLVQGSLQTVTATLTFFSPDESTESLSPGGINQPDDDDTTDDVTACRAVEVNIDATMFATDQGCAADTVFLPAGETTKGCVITNTVFFEGIPTLGSYGLMIMALMMLGVGAIGIRRFT